MADIDLCIVSGGDEIRNRSYVNHAVAARVHGFSHHLGIGLAPGITSQYYYKFEVILEVLPRYDWVVWLDDDVYITDVAADSLQQLVAQAVRDDAFAVIAEGPLEPDGSWTPINTGVMVLRNDERTLRLLRRAMAFDLDDLREQWSEVDQGLFTNGDQDAIWWAIQESAEVRSGVQIVGHRQLNSRPHYYRDSLTDAWAVHFCGPGDKDLKIGQFARRFGLGQELVPPTLLEWYSVRKREVMSDAEIRARQLIWAGRQGLKRVRRKIDFVRHQRRWR